MILKDREIDYKLLSFAIDYYKGNGFEYIETPWIVDYENCIATAPDNEPGYAVEVNPPNSNNPLKEYLVCSAEQGFVQMFKEHLLSSNTRYCSVSPCFRYEDDTEIHSKEFIKLELFLYSFNYDEAKKHVLTLLNLAYDFIQSHIDHNVIVVKNSDVAFDIVTADNLELGSYGLRTIDSRAYIVYGTGLALPRASLAFELSNKGYHVSPVPRGKPSESSKILEEVYELIDAEKQNNKIMQLCELGDIVAAVDMYIKKYHHGITLDDVLEMAKVTDRAFKSGRRS